MDVKSKIIMVLLLLGSVYSQIMAQAYVEKDIKDFGASGTGITNDHDAFQAASGFFNKRGGRGKLIVSKGVYVVGKQTKKNGYFLYGESILSFKNIKNFIIEFKDNAVIKLKDGLKIGSFDPQTGKPYEHGSQFTRGDYLASPNNILEIYKGDNIQILNVRINGNQNKMITGGRFGDVGFQLPADGIFLSECSNVLVKGGYVKNSARDGIQITDNREVTMSTPPKNIIIDDFTCDMSARQGLSITGGNGIVVKNSNFNNTYQGKIKSPPGSGVDVEAENSMVRDIKFINCYFINNGNTAFVADSGPVRDIYFDGCIFHGLGGWTAWTTKPNTKFYNSKFYGCIVHGYDSPNDADATEYINCHFENLPLNGTPAYNGAGQFHLMEINYKRRQKWINCTFVSHFNEQSVNSRPYYFENAWPNEDATSYPVLKNCVFHFSVDMKKQYGKKPEYILVLVGANLYNVTNNIYGASVEEFNANWYMAGGSYLFYKNYDGKWYKDINSFKKKFPYKSPNYGTRYTPPNTNN